MNVIPKILFVFSLCLLALLYGVFAGHYETFPHGQLMQARSAAEALSEAFNPGLNGGGKGGSPSRAVPVVRNPAGVDDGALILVSGGPDYLESYNPAGGCLAWLMDREGEIKHIWKYDPTLWDDLEDHSVIPGMDAGIFPVAVHLLEDGGLLASFVAEHAWPGGVGIVRLDRASNVLWKTQCNAHHWFILTADRKILTPTQRVRKAPYFLGYTKGRIRSETGEFLEDMISVLDLDSGEVLEERSVLGALLDSGLVGLYQGATGKSGKPDVNESDPLHLNDVRRVGEEVASARDWLEPDDVLVSMRSINTLAIVDWETWRVKWYTVGTTLAQHSPRFLDAENILVFDNIGGDKMLGGTRIARIGLEDRLAESVYPTREYRPDDPIFSQYAGHLDLNRGRDAVLMTVTTQARLLEIGLDIPRILWECRFEDAGDMRILTAKYCYDVDFEMNQAGESSPPSRRPGRPEGPGPQRSP